MTDQRHDDTHAGDAASIIPAEYEYSTLMRLLGVSVSKHLLDEHFTLIWANEFYYQLIGWPKDEYEEEALRNCIKGVRRRAGRIQASVANPQEKRGLCLGSVFHPVCGGIYRRVPGSLLHPYQCGRPYEDAQRAVGYI